MLRGGATRGMGARAQVVDDAEVYSKVITSTIELPYESEFMFNLISLAEITKRRVEQGSSLLVARNAAFRP